MLVKTYINVCMCEACLQRFAWGNNYSRARPRRGIDLVIGGLDVLLNLPEITAPARHAYAAHFRRDFRQRARTKSATNVKLLLFMPTAIAS